MKMRKGSNKATRLYLFMRQKIKWSSWGRQAATPIYMILSIVLFIKSIEYVYYGELTRALICLALMVIAAWIFFWPKITEASEMIEIFIWGMPIKDPDWKTQRWKRKLVWKKKKV